MIDAYLRITGSNQRAIDAVTTMGLSGEVLPRDEQGAAFIGDHYNHDVAVNYIPDLVTDFGTVDVDGNMLTAPTRAGPHLMVRFISDTAMQKAQVQIIDAVSLPSGLDRASAPSTIGWFGGASGTIVAGELAVELELEDGTPLLLEDGSLWLLED